MICSWRDEDPSDSFVMMKKHPLLSMRSDMHIMPVREENFERACFNIGLELKEVLIVHNIL